jgi:hypothetical protein
MRRQAAVASATREELADWLELEAMLSASKSASITDLERVVRASGTVDANDPGSAQSQQIAEEALNECSDRALSLGRAYPFEVSQNVVKMKKRLSATDYGFLLLLSVDRANVFQTSLAPTRVFEEMCVRAARGYLGPGARALRFGSPRSTPYGRLRSALDWLAKECGEGGGHRPENAAANSNGDEQLDVVAWREFQDKRRSKLMLCGQCATGADKKKRVELDVEGFWKTYLHHPPYVTPMKSFFVPWRVSHTDWEKTSRMGGILFDRCRIAAFAAKAASTGSSMQQKWAKRAAAEIEKTEKARRVRRKIR